MHCVLRLSVISLGSVFKGSCGCRRAPFGPQCCFIAYLCKWLQSRRAQARCCRCNTPSCVSHVHPLPLSKADERDTGHGDTGHGDTGHMEMDSTCLAHHERRGDTGVPQRCLLRLCPKARPPKRCALPHLAACLLRPCSTSLPHLCWVKLLLHAAPLLHFNAATRFPSLVLPPRLTSPPRCCTSRPPLTAPHFSASLMHFNAATRFPSSLSPLRLTSPPRCCTSRPPLTALHCRYSLRLGCVPLLLLVQHPFAALPRCHRCTSFLRPTTPPLPCMCTRSALLAARSRHGGRRLAVGVCLRRRGGGLGGHTQGPCAARHRCVRACWALQRV